MTTTYPPPRPQVRSPEVPWTGPHESGVVSPMLGRRQTWTTWRRLHHEWIRVVGATVHWSTPGWSMPIRTEGDMNAARALCLGLGSKERLDTLEAAWTARVKEE